MFNHFDVVALGGKQIKCIIMQYKWTVYYYKAYLLGGFELNLWFSLNPE